MLERKKIWVHKDYFNCYKEEILGMVNNPKHVGLRKTYKLKYVQPLFSCLRIVLTLQWLKKNLGGIAAIEKINNARAALIYAEIDEINFYLKTAVVEDRSNMNATFLLNGSSCSNI
jgi:phosphoserine aminotransferase